MDFTALSERLGPDRVQKALDSLDELYPQTSGALQQLQVQLSNPMPYDLADADLTEYRRLHPEWHDWSRVKEICATIAIDLFKRL